jgi:hypothetical protein
MIHEYKHNKIQLLLPKIHTRKKGKYRIEKLKVKDICFKQSCNVIIFKEHKD